MHPEEHIFRNSQTWEYDWSITSGYLRPDGVLKRVYLINGEFPGPTIEARSGDHFIVNVENALQNGDGLSIHWHGLSMRGFNKMDGAVGVTQAPIKPGENFTYEFTIEDCQHGTFWYHAHEGVQRADGLYGGFIIHEPAEDRQDRRFGAEHLLLVGDWYHRSAQDALHFYSHPGAFGLETVPDSMLLNGVGSFKCSDAVPSRPLDCITTTTEKLPVLTVHPNKDNLFRVINVGAYSGINLRLEGSVLRPVSVDGGHEIMGPPSKSVGFMHPGERATFLLEQAPDAARYGSSLEISFDRDVFKYENPALTPRHTFVIQGLDQVSGRERLSGPISEHFDIQTVKSAESQTEVLPRQPDQTIVLYAITQKLTRLKNEPLGFLNHSTWKTPIIPLNKVSRTQWDAENQFVPRITFNITSPLWIDIILNNLDEEGHPFHLHGYDFWVLSTYSSTFNWGSYNPYEDSEPPGGEYDLVGAVKRDTVYVPRRGYAVLRLRADNPGLWMFHCHVLWHLGSGMAMAFEVRD